MSKIVHIYHGYHQFPVTKNDIESAKNKKYHSEIKRKIER